MYDSCRERARSAQRLIEEKDSAAAGANWPDACRANLFAGGVSDSGPIETRSGSARLPGGGALGD
jgi:hypothetical protein